MTLSDSRVDSEATVAPATAPPVFDLRDRQVAAILGVLSFAVLGLAARIRRLNTALAGDEPHYLIINVALEKYRSLNVTSVYRTGDYWPFHPAEIAPQIASGPDGPLPVHSIGGPILWHLPYLVAGRSGAMAFVTALSVLTVVNIFFFLRENGVTQGCAGLVAALFAVGSPIYIYSSMLFIEPIAALAILYAIRMVCRPDPGGWRTALASGGLGILPWVHPRFIVFSLLIGGLLVGRLWWRFRLTAWRPYAFGLGPLAALLIGLEVYHAAVWHTLDIAPNLAGAGASALGVSPLTGLLGMGFDRGFGILPNFPLFVLVLPGLLFAFRRGLLVANVAILVTVVPHLVVASTFSEWWGGFSPPARHAAAVAPLLALYVAICLQRLDHLAVTVGAVALAGISFALGVIGDLSGPVRFSTPDRPDRQGPALDRLGDVLGLDLVRYVPSSFLPGQGPLVAWWVAAVAIVAGGLWLAGLWLAGRDRGDPGDPLPGRPDVPEPDVVDPLTGPEERLQRGS